MSQRSLYLVACIVYRNNPLDDSKWDLLTSPVAWLESSSRWLWEIKKNLLCVKTHQIFPHVFVIDPFFISSCDGIQWEDYFFIIIGYIREISEFSFASFFISYEIGDLYIFDILTSRYDEINLPIAVFPHKNGISVWAKMEIDYVFENSTDITRIITTSEDISYTDIWEIIFVIYIKNLFSDDILPAYFLCQKNTAYMVEIFEYDIRIDADFLWL